MLIVFEGLGFIFLGFVLLYLLSIYSNSFVMYFLLALSVLSFAIGFHIILALVMHIIRVRKRRVVESEREGEAVGELAM
jgi:amino acid permease